MKRNSGLFGAMSLIVILHLASDLPRTGAVEPAVPTKAEILRLFSDQYTDRDTREMQAMGFRILGAGEAILPDLMELYREYLPNRDSGVAGNCADHILRIAEGGAADAVIRFLLDIKDIRAQMLALDVATTNALPSEGFRAVARGLFARSKEFTEQTGLSGVELLVRFERYCRDEDALRMIELLTKTSGAELSSRQRGAALLAKIGDEKSLADLRRLQEDWRREEPARIRETLQQRKLLAEEGGNVWDPKSPAATKGLREDWLNSIGASITNLEARLRKEGRLLPSSK